MNYEREMNDYRRLIVLEILQNSPSYTSNEHMIGELLPGFGLGVSTDKLRSELGWLEEQGLVTNKKLGEGRHEIWVPELTKRGEDVAKGRATVPGVKRPGPRG